MEWREVITSPLTLAAVVGVVVMHTCKSVAWAAGLGVVCWAAVRWLSSPTSPSPTPPSPTPSSPTPTPTPTPSTPTTKPGLRKTNSTCACGGGHSYMRRVTGGSEALMFPPSMVERILSGAGVPSMDRQYVPSPSSKGREERARMIVLGRILQRRFERKRAMHRKRTRIAQEIVDTESSYVRSLVELQELYYLPMQGENLLTKDELKAVFGNLIVILRYNEVLLMNLEARMKSWSPHTRLGNIFLEMADFLKVYVSYVNNYENAMTTLDAAKRSRKRVASFLQGHQQNMGITSYLIMPVQRIPRYNLLLEELVRNTWMDHVDHKDLCGALSKMKEVAEYCNERKREVENMNLVWQIQDKIHHPQLLTPHRRFVRDGHLTKLRHDWSIRSPRESGDLRYVVLFNDALVYCKPRTLSSEFSFRRLLTLDTVANQPTATQIHGEPYFILTTPEREYAFGTESMAERDAWIADITSALKQRPRRRVTVA